MSLEHDALPPPARVRLRLTSPAERAVRAGHPWIYEASITRQDREGEAGDLAVIYDSHNRFLALGLYDPGSPIRVRLLQTGRPAELNQDWWRGRLEQALGRREGLFGPDTTGYRCIHGESDGWPGLVLDRYEETLVLKLYSAAWFPHLERVAGLIRQAMPQKRLVLRLSRNIQAGDEASSAGGTILYGDPVREPVTFLESGIRFQSDVLRGQKTGFFLDQRENRRQVELLARGRSVLNAFSFTGGFSLYAARGGAASVTDLDISPHALEAGLSNLRLNSDDPRIRDCPHSQVKADAFDWLRESSDRFDLVVLDPPSLARRAAQADQALRAYDRLLRTSVERLRKGGILVAASCSAHVSSDAFFTLARGARQRSGRRFRELAVTGHPPDHPATHLEAHYLKCIYLQLD